MAQPASLTPECCKLRRSETSTAWGFRLEGGRDKQLPLFVATCKAGSLAAKAGLLPGDAIVQICGTNVMTFTHQDAKSEMMRAGNEVDLWVIRGAVNPSDPAVKAACGVGGKNRRVVLDEGSIDPHMNEGTKYRNVMPKSYQMLEAQLGPGEGGAPEQQAAAAAPAAPQGGATPGSIFDRSNDERSDYLKAQGDTIQMAYGQNQ